MIPIVSDLLSWVRSVTDSFDTEWDDGCPGLVATLAREAEWKAQEASNNAVQWGVSAVMDGWEVTPPASPMDAVDVVEDAAWPGALADEHYGVWPSSAELAQAHCDAWPGFPSDIGGIEVIMEVCSSVWEVAGEHSTYRFFMT
jgi:hypothetical protein